MSEISMISSIISTLSGLTASDPDFTLALEGSAANDTQVGGTHYESQYQHWDFMADLTPSWPEGCMSKYLCRVFKKNGLQDVEKVIHYCFKLMQQVHAGLILPPEKSPGLRSNLYLKFYHAQDLRAPTEELRRLVREVFRHLAIWTNMRDLKIVFDSAVALRAAMLSHALERERINSDDLAAEPTSAYVDQDQTPSKVTSDSGLESLLRTLSTVMGSHSAVAESQVVFPISVYSSLLEELRRDSDSSFNLSTMPYAPSWSRDYSEACLKIDLGSQTLDEALPNKQTRRAMAGMHAILDGTLCLLGWFAQRTAITSDGRQASGILPLISYQSDVTREYASTKLSIQEINEYLGQEVWKT